MTSQLDRIEAKLDVLIDALAGRKAQAPPRGKAPLPGAVADDRELDSQYGDPEVFKDPPRWHGDTWKGRKFSECPAEFLDELAGFKEWCASKDDENGDEKKAGYNRRDAARARGWAARKRAGWKPAASMFGDAPPDDGDAFGNADNIPF